MIVVKNPNELACCKCEFREISLSDNGWTCVLTRTKGYPHYADAFVRLDDCPLCPSTTKPKYAYGTQHPFNNIDVVINCKKINFTIGEIAIELNNEAIDEINAIEINGKKFIKVDNREEKR